MRLIDADELREKFCRDDLGFGYCVDCSWNRACEKIQDAPTVDNELVRHGHWEEIRNAYGELEGWLCECGREVKSKYNYCPNCGAKMDLEVK